MVKGCHFLSNCNPFPVSQPQHRACYTLLDRNQGWIYRFYCQCTLKITNLNAPLVSVSLYHPEWQNIHPWMQPSAAPSLTLCPPPGHPPPPRHSLSLLKVKVPPVPGLHALCGLSSAVQLFCSVISWSSRAIQISTFRIKYKPLFRMKNRSCIKNCVLSMSLCSESRKCQHNIPAKCHSQNKCTLYTLLHF